MNIRPSHWAVCLLAIGLGVTFLAVRASWPIDGALRPAELALDDFRPIYTVGSGPDTIHKLEWSFRDEWYARVVLEQRDAKDAPWQVVGSCPWRSPSDQVALIYQFGKGPNDIAPPGEIARSVEVYCRSTRTLAGGFQEPVWCGSVLPMHFARPKYFGERHSHDPNCVLFVTDGNRAYRVRLERSKVPFGSS